MSGKAVIIHSLDHARAALAAAEACGTAVTLLSAEAAAGSAGAPWFAAVVGIASADCPAVEVRAVLDCGDRPGDVIGALHQDIKAVRFTGRKAVAERLRAVAGEYDAVLLTGRIKALDLLDHPAPEAACRDWLKSV